jgi:hypothetical protein
MNQKQKLKLFKILAAVLGLFVVMVYAVPMITLSATAAAWLVEFQNFFVDIKDVVTGNFFYVVLLLVAAVLSAFYLWYKPKKAGKGKKAKEITTARKVVLGVILVAIVIALIVPFVTLQATAAAWLVDFQGYMIDFKDTLTTDFNILALAIGVLWIIYHFFVHDPKAIKR